MALLGYNGGLRGKPRIPTTTSATVENYLSEKWGITLEGQGYG